MIRTAERYGVTFIKHHPDCGGNVHGWFVKDTKTIVFCRLHEMNAETIDTAKHEIFHFIQSCQTNKAYLEPLIKNKANFVYFVERTLSPGQVDMIKMTYPRHKWAIEMEAFAAAQQLTSNTIRLYIEKYCG